MSRNVGKAVLFFVVVWQPAVFAVEFDAEVSAGVGTSDNITRIAQNEIDETIITAGISLGVIEQNRTLDLAIQSQFDHLEYSDGTVEAEWIGGLTGTATVTLIDERLRWVFQENYGQRLFDPLQPARPGNREDINIFTTGPTINLFASDRNTVRADVRYTRSDFEIRPNDGDRLSSTLSYRRAVNRQSTLSANLTGARSGFESSAVSPPVEIYQAFLRLENIREKNSLTLDAGYNEVEFSGIEADGFLFRFDWSHSISANGSISIAGGSQYSEQGDIFRSLQDISSDIANTFDVLNDNSAFLNNNLTIGYSLQTVRYSINASGGWDQQDFKAGQNIDRDIYRGRLGLQREVSKAVFAATNIAFLRREFKYLSRRDDDLTLGIEVGYRITDGLRASVEYQHFRRNSITPNADFTENRAFLRFTYTPVWSR